MIQTGDYIIYGSNGVCKVENVGTVERDGIPSDKPYYTLIPVYTKGNRIYTPVDNKKVVIRPVISKEEAQSLLNSFDNLDTLDIAEDRKGEEIIKEILAKCNCHEIAKLFKTLYIKKLIRNSQGKKQTVRQDKYFNLSKDNLVKEIALSLGMEKDRAEELLIENVSKSCHI